MMEWQPIETAPKDGTEILGFGVVAGEINGPENNASRSVIAWIYGKGDYVGFDWDVVATDAYAVWMNPTNWMPLPQPPE